MGRSGFRNTGIVSGFCIQGNLENPGFDRDQKYKSVIRTMKSIEDSGILRFLAEFRAILRGYQKTGFRWLRPWTPVVLGCNSG